MLLAGLKTASTKKICYNIFFFTFSITEKYAVGDMFIYQLTP